MNYYTAPNYMNYPYNQYQYMPQQQPQQFNIPQPQSSSPALPGLNGKIVDGEDVVKATEVPIGGYGVFPKADLSEIYLKTWNNNGTTSVIKFRPISENTVEEVKPSSVNDFTQLMEKINGIESKLDDIFASQKQQKSEVKKNNGF